MISSFLFLFYRHRRAPVISLQHWTLLVLSVWMGMVTWLPVCLVEGSLSSFLVGLARRPTLAVAAGLRTNQDHRAGEWHVALQVSGGCTIVMSSINLFKMVTHGPKPSGCNREVAALKCIECCHLELELSGCNKEVVGLTKN